MNDKQTFQETAQTLIDYDVKHSFRYQEDEYEYKKSFNTNKKLTIVLIIIGFINLFEFIASGGKIGKDFIILTVIFIIWFKRQSKKKKIQRTVEERREGLLNDVVRTSCIETLNQLSDAHPEWGVEAWWNEINGMAISAGRYNAHRLVFFPEEIIGTDRRGNQYIVKENYTLNIVNGEYVHSLIESGDYRSLDIIPTTYLPKSTYNIAALCLYRSSIHMETYERKTYSSNEVSTLMSEYSDKLDERERNRNFWEDFGHGRYETNEEKHERKRWDSREDYDANQDIDDWFTRMQKEEKHKRELENSISTESYIESFEQDLYWVGWLIFSAREDLLSILLNKEYAQHGLYYTNTDDLGEECIIKREGSLNEYEREPKMPIEAIFSKFATWDLDKMDFTSKRPPEFTLREWAQWIYAHTT